MRRDFYGIMLLGYHLSETQVPTILFGHCSCVILFWLSFYDDSTGREWKSNTGRFHRYCKKYPTCHRGNAGDAASIILYICFSDYGSGSIKGEPCGDHSIFCFFLGSIVSISVFVFALYFPWRALCATTVFLILANVILLNELWNSRYLLLISAITSGFALYCTFSFALAVGDIGVLYMESKQREAVIISGIEDGVDPIMVHRYSSNTKYAASYLLPDLYEDSWEWPNYDIAEYFGAPAIVGLPPEEVFGTG